MTTIGIHSIIERVVSLRVEGHVMNPNHVRGILTQMEWSVGVNEPRRAIGGLDAIIELATRMRDEGREIDASSARGIMQQIEWVITSDARRFEGRAHVPALVQEPQQIETRMIDSKEFESLCEDACAICMENHKFGEMIITECNHTFCGGCWNEWINRSRAKTCPSCRKVNPSITCFATK